MNHLLLILVALPIALPAPRYRWTQWADTSAVLYVHNNHEQGGWVCGGIQPHQTLMEQAPWAGPLTRNWDYYTLLSGKARRGVSGSDVSRAVAEHAVEQDCQ